MTAEVIESIPDRTLMCRASSRTVVENVVDPIPKGSIDDGLMLAGIGRALVHRLAHVDPIIDELVDVALVDELPCFPRIPSVLSACTKTVAEPIFANRSNIMRTVAASGSFTRMKLVEVIEYIDDRAVSTCATGDP